MREALIERPAAQSSSDAVDYVVEKLDWLQRECIWPNEHRCLWTDALGLVLYVSLYHHERDTRWIDAAEALVADAPEQGGESFHDLAMWMFALARLGALEPRHRAHGIELAREAHAAFVDGFGAMDAFNGYVAYRLLGDRELAPQIADARELIERDYPHLELQQDLALGTMLWLAHFYPNETWARTQTTRSLQTLERMWMEPSGYFCRTPDQPHTALACANYGISLGLQASSAWPTRVARLDQHFEQPAVSDADRDATRWVMACVAHLPGAMLRGPLR